MSVADEEAKAKALKEQREELEKIAKLRGEEVKDIKTLADLEERIREIKFDAELASKMSDRVEMNKQLYDITELMFNLQQKFNAAEGEEKAIYEAQIASLENMAQALENNGAIAKKYTEDQKKLQTETDNMFGSLLEKTALMQDASRTAVGGLMRMASAAQSTDDIVEVMTNSFLKSFNVLNLATGLFYTIVEATTDLVKRLDAASTSFAAATGQGDAFTKTIGDVAIEGNHLGITMAEAGAATKDLLTSTALFSEQSKKMKKSMTTLAAELSKIGVDGGTAAESLNIFQLNMGMSGNEAIKMSKKLAMMGKAMGKTSAQMSKDFQQAFSVLAVHGEESIQVFQGLSAAAKTAGLEVSKLTTLAGKFDTFESAATTTGKLNALLGSQLSATEMLMMKEDERIETLIRQVQAQDVAFKDMDRFQQKAIAAAAGITDMNEAQRIFGMNMEQFGDHREKMEKQTNVQENFAKAIDATLPLQEKVSIFFREFAIVVQPILGYMESFLDIMISAANAVGETGMQIVFATSVLTIGIIAYKAYAGIIAKTAAIKKTVVATTEMMKAATLKNTQQLGADTIAQQGNTASKTAAIPPTIGLGNATGQAGAAASAGAVGFLSFAAGIAAVAAGVGIAIAAYAKYIEAQARVEAQSARSVEALSSFSKAMVDTKTLDAGLSIMKSRLAEIKSLLTEDDAVLAQGLENLALAATGVSARKMSGGAAEVATTLKTAVAAAVTSRHEITLKLKDNALFDLIDKEGSRALSSTNGEMRKAVLKIIND